MKKLFSLALVLALFLGFAGTSRAADQDLGKFTCQELLASGTQNITMMMFWMDGYLSAQSDNTVLSDAWLQKFGNHISTYCAANPKKTLMDIMANVPE